LAKEQARLLLLDVLPQRRTVTAALLRCRCAILFSFSIRQYVAAYCFHHALAAYLATPAAAPSHFCRHDITPRHH
jgi:hypothetical protein